MISAPFGLQTILFRFRFRFQLHTQSPSERTIRTTRTTLLLLLLMLATCASAVSRASVVVFQNAIRPSGAAFAHGTSLWKQSRLSLGVVRSLSSAPLPDDKPDAHQPFSEWDVILDKTSPQSRRSAARSDNDNTHDDDHWNAILADDNDDTDENEDEPLAASSLRPVLKYKSPPPRARRMPPTLESFESSNYLVGDDWGTAAADFGAYDYQPELHDDAITSPTKATTLSSSSLGESVPFADDIPALSTPWDGHGERVPSPLPHKRPMPPRATFHGPSSVATSDRTSTYEQASSGDAITSSVAMLTSKLHQLEKEIYAENNGEVFNVNSPKQVSQVLFGEAGQSTNKEALEAMGGAGNRMADLILQYRQCVRAIAREEKKQDTISTGRQVKSALAQSRANPETNATSGTEADGNDPLLLVDASAYIFRAYYSMPPLHRADGTPVGAVLGFCNMLNRLVLNRLLQGERPRLVLVFDSKGKTFRHDMYDEYKTNRPECPMDLIPQFDLIREAAEAYGIHQLEAPLYEADDVIATLATLALGEGVDTSILSGDKDLMQLITNEDATPVIDMIDPGSMSRITHDVVVEKWNVEPKLVGDVLALAGDSSDNIPGVKGIGPKIAASLLDEFGSLDELLERLDDVKQKGRREKLQANVDLAKLSRRLVELERHIPMANMTFPEDAGSVADLRMEPINGERMLDFFQHMGFRDLRRRFEGRLQQMNRKQSTPAPVTKRPARRKNRRVKATIPQPEDYEDVPF